MLLGEKGSGGHPLRFEPEDETQARFLHGIANCLQPMGKTVFGFDSVDGESVVALAGGKSAQTGPVGIEPEGLEPEGFDRIQVREHVLLVAGVFLIEGGARLRDGQHNQLAVDPGHDVGEHRGETGCSRAGSSPNQ